MECTEGIYICFPDKSSRVSSSDICVLSARKSREPWVLPFQHYFNIQCSILLEKVTTAVVGFRKRLSMSSVRLSASGPVPIYLCVLKIVLDFHISGKRSVEEERG